MSSIPTPLRQRIDDAAAEMIAIAEKIRAIFPQLADLYDGLGRAIKSSHYKNKETGRNNIEFVLPADCCIVLSGDKSHYMATGPVSVNIVVPGRDLAGFWKSMSL